MEKGRGKGTDTLQTDNVFARKESFHPAIVTNADRIRAMTDEELAEWIAVDVLNLTGGSLEMATEAWADWLKQEATE